MLNDKDKKKTRGGSKVTKAGRIRTITHKIPCFGISIECDTLFITFHIYSKKTEKNLN